MKLFAEKDAQAYAKSGASEFRHNRDIRLTPGAKDVFSEAGIKVVFDAANLLSAENIQQQARLIPEALDLLGDEIAVVHAKDFVYENGAKRTVPAGRGQLDFAPVLKFIRSQSSGVGVLLEEADETTAPQCAGFLRKHFQEIEA